MYFKVAGYGLANPHFSALAAFLRLSHKLPQRRFGMHLSGAKNRGLIMIEGYDAAERLRVAADRLLSENGELSFTADALSSAALKLSQGNMDHAIELLESVEALLSGATKEMRGHPAPPSFLDTLIDRK